MTGAHWRFSDEEKNGISSCSRRGNRCRWTEMLQTLAERNFPADKVYALASSKSVGRELSYGEDVTLTVESLEKFDFANADIALFSAGGDTSKAYAPKAGTLAVSSSIILRPSGWMKMCR